MNTPWSKLLQYGTGFATIVVILITGVILSAFIAVAVLISKLLVLIK